MLAAKAMPFCLTFKPSELKQLCQKRGMSGKRIQEIERTLEYLKEMWSIVNDLLIICSYHENNTDQLEWIERNAILLNRHFWKHQGLY